MNHTNHEDDLQPAMPHYSLATAARHLLILCCIAYGLVRLLPVLQAIGAGVTQ